MQYAIYLRKSRADNELEAAGAGDTLARHRKTLLELAASRKLPVAQIYEEVVSGETLAARPEMQKLLAEVDQGVYAGVLVMEVERLARGDTIDQGIVAQSFKYSGTKIITPAKTYDPDNEFDEEYFEFGLFMSRREYKTINRRLQRGRVASVNEGKWPANKAPYGYRKVKLEHEKGFVLEPVEDQAQWVRRMFEWYTAPTEYPPGQVHTLGRRLIAKRLNELGVPSPNGGAWTSPVIQGILSNPAYAGMIRWGSRAQKKVVENGTVTIKRPRSSDPLIKPGRHPAIVDIETWDLTQKLLKHPSRPGPKQVEIKNPLAGIVVCGCCGHVMSRRPYQSGRQEMLLCSYESCSGTVASDLRDVEQALYSGLEQWLKEYRVAQETDSVPDTSAVEAALATLEKESSQMEAQKSRVYDLVEQGVYSPEVFRARMETIEKRQRKIEEQRDVLQTELDRLHEVWEARTTIIPQMRHVLDIYWSSTAAQRNQLLKSVLDKVEYRKTRRERWKGGGDMTLTIFPKLPNR